MLEPIWGLLLSLLIFIINSKKICQFKIPNGVSINASKEKHWKLILFFSKLIDKLFDHFNYYFGIFC